MQRKGVLPGKIFAPCVPERRFAGLFGCMARISCQNQLISDAWRANLAANWRFSRPRPLLGCMERKTCHGLPPGNAPWRNLATARHLGTHRASILPLLVRPRAHQCAVLPPSDAGKRISRAFCHRRAPGNAPWRNLATASRPRTHSRRSCHGRTLGFAPHQITATLPAKNGAEGRTWRTSPRQKHERQSAGAAGASSGYGAVQRHRRTLGNAARRNIAMADNAPRDKKKASILLAFFCCFVYGSSGHRSLRGRKPPAFGSLLDWGTHSVTELSPAPNMPMASQCAKILARID